MFSLKYTRALVSINEVLLRTSIMKRFCLRVVIALCVVQTLGAVKIAADPPPGTIRMLLGAEIATAFLVDTHRIQSASDIFNISLDEIYTFDTTSSNQLFGLGIFLDTTYRAYDWLALGIRGGILLNLVGVPLPVEWRIPLLATSTFFITEWFAVGPAVGVNIILDPSGSPHLDARVLVRFLDAIEVHAGYLYGAISGFHFEVALRLFDVFRIDTSGSAPEQP